MAMTTTTTTTTTTPAETVPAFLAEDRSGVLVGISVSLMAATTVVLLLRVYAKRFQGVGGFFADDAFLLAAYIVNLGMCVVGIVITQVGGVGRHMAFLEIHNPAALGGWARCLFAFELIYFVSIALPKLSILCLYLRLFAWKGYRRVLAWLLFALVAATSTALVVAACFQCVPLAYFWDRTIPGGRCFDIQKFFHGQALPGAVLDVCIMLLPVGTIWELNMPVVKRLALVGVFAIASFGFVASVIRARIFFSTEALKDETWASVELIGWSIVETSVYIITVCLPHLRPLISHYTPAWLKRAVHLSVLTRSGGGSKSYGATTSKRFSGIHKSTAISHTRQMKSGSHDHHDRNDDDDDDDAIELTRGTAGGGGGDEGSWIAQVSMDLERANSPAGLSLGSVQSQAMGVTTEIISPMARHPVR